MGAPIGAYKTAARRTGLTLEEWLAKREAGLLWCFRCRSWKPRAAFSGDASRNRRQNAACKPCTSAASTASRYGTTTAALAEQRARQGGRCAVCRRARTLVVDHDHQTGAVRELLCTPCNSGLGLFGDDPARLRAAATYLEAHRG